MRRLGSEISALRILCLAVALFAGRGPSAAAEPQTDPEGYVAVDLKFVPWKQPRSKEGHEHLPFTCPRSLEGVDEVQDASGQQYLPLQFRGHPGVRVVSLETSLELDLDNDGRIDAKAKGRESCIPTTLVAADGAPVPYLLRVTRVEISGSSVDWVYQRSCFMEGVFDRTRICLIDDDSNGIYGEVGRDAIAIGNQADHAVPLGKMVHINGRIYHVKVEATGARMWLKPYEGETGRIDASGGYQAVGKLAWAVFRSGDSWFDCAGRSGEAAVSVPVGTYEFEMGRVVNRPQGARIRKGRMPSVQVRRDETTRLAWGGPVTIRFDYQFQGRVLAIGPNRMGMQMVAQGMAPANVRSRVVGMVAHEGGGDEVEAEGRAGEVYWRFEPEDMTPKVMIRKKDSKKIVHRGTIILQPDPRRYHPGWAMWRNEYSEQVKNEQGPFEVRLEEDQFTKLFREFMVGDWK